MTKYPLCSCHSERAKRRGISNPFTITKKRFLPLAPTGGDRWFACAQNDKTESCCYKQNEPMAMREYCPRVASCDQSLIAKSNFTSTLFKRREGNPLDYPLLFVCHWTRLFFSDPRGTSCTGASRDQSLKGSPIAKSYFTSTLFKRREGNPLD